VEADIYLVDGKLLVAHNRNKVQPDRTLETLYLAPLRARIRENGGRVFKNGPQVSLLIDLKTDWHSTYPALRAVLTNYTDILTTWTREKVSTNALLVVVSGSRAREMFAGETWRVAAFDGELRDLESSCSSADIPWISHNWRSSFKWSGRGDMPPDELQRLTSILQQAHMQGRRVRLWGAPDNAVFWQCLCKLGVDLINTDDLAGLRDFLVSTSKAPTHSTPSKERRPAQARRRSNPAWFRGYCSLPRNIANPKSEKPRSITVPTASGTGLPGMIEVLPPPGSDCMCAPAL
jgi:hypothetical protein